MLALGVPGDANSAASSGPTHHQNHKGITMKKALIGIYLVTLATMTWASCTTHTYNKNGRIVICNTCCYGTNCTTNCF